MEPLNRLNNIPFYQRDRYPNSKALNYKENGKWIHYDIEDICNEIDQLAAGLNKRYPNRKNIGIYAQSGCPQWNIIDFAIIKSGHVSVPLHGNASKIDLVHIMEDAELHVVFVQGKDQVEKIESLDVASVDLYTFEELDGVSFYKNLFSQDMSLVDEVQIKPDDLATILYTSGSTGMPKGVMLSHDNIISNIKSVISLVPVTHRHTTASYLPLSHIFERVASFVFMTVGASIYYIDDPKSLISNVLEIRPHYMTSVPRVIEKVYDHIYKGVKDSGFVQKQVIKWALASSKKGRKHSVNPLRRIELILCDLLVFRKWRKILGGRMKGLIVGAASMPRHISYLFNDAGIKIREGYGLTETSPIVSFNRFEPGGNKFGTVGIPIPSVDVKIHEPNKEGEGEIIVKGPNVMLGYYNNKELTAEKIDKNGYFHTGDVGKFVRKRFLTITDRKKNIFKTSSGQYIAPQILENHLKRQNLIDQAMVIGFNKPFVTSLIVPNFPLLESWCRENNVHWTGPQYMVLHPKVVGVFEELIEEVNSHLKRHEFIKKFHLLHEEWSVDSGEYTPTLKLKRREIISKFEKQITKMYK